MQILLWWNVQQPVSGNTLKDIVQKFILTILDEKVYITLTEDEIYIFKNKKGLSIKYETMDGVELRIIESIYKQRYKMFENVERYQSGGWKITKYINAEHKILWTQTNRREMVRDFIYVLLSQTKVIPSVKSILIGVVQNLIENEKKRDNLFIGNLHDKLQHIGDINNLRVIY